MSTGTYVVAVVLGYLYGRKSSAETVEVPPKIVFARSTDLTPPPGQLLSFSEVARGAGLPEGLAERVSKALEGSEAVKKLHKLLVEREFCHWALRESAKALADGWIPPEVYQSIVRRYMAELVRIENELEQVSGEAEAEIARIVREALEQQAR